MRCVRKQACVIVVLLLCLCCACGKTIQEVTIDNQDAKDTLIIAAVNGKTSVFKDMVIQGLIDRYEPTCAIEVSKVSHIEQLAHREYDVIVLVDTCRASMRFNTTVKKLIDALDQKKLVVFITAGDPDFTYHYQGIDAVTSASEQGREDVVIQAIAAQIAVLLRE